MSVYYRLPHKEVIRMFQFHYNHITKIDGIYSAYKQKLLDDGIRLTCGVFHPVVLRVAGLDVVDVCGIVGRASKDVCAVGVLDCGVSVGLSGFRLGIWDLTVWVILFFYYMPLHNSIFGRMGHKCLTDQLTQIQIFIPEGDHCIALSGHPLCSNLNLIS